MITPTTRDLKQMHGHQRSSQALPHVLFVVGQLSIGGIETYVVRMARAYSLAGGRVSAWIVKHSWDAELLSMLKGVAEVSFVASAVMRYPAWMRSPLLPADVDLVFTTGRLSLLTATHACARARRPVRLIAAVFSQWEYCSDDTNPKSRLAAEVLGQIGPANMVFCTEGCKRDHQARLNTDLMRSIVSPLLVELPEVPPRKSRRSGDPLKIMSISRLVKFKTSNEQMPHIIKELAEAGVDACWTHYGDGPEMANIEGAIAAAGVESRVVLAGPIAYSKIHSKIAESDLYIGGGTTLIEAAALGVPSLVALDENPNATTPGFFFDRHGHYTSDLAGDERLERFADVIKRFWALDEFQLQQYRTRSIERARQYSVENSSAELQKIFLNAKPVVVEEPNFFQFRFMWGNLKELLISVTRSLKLTKFVDDRRR